MEFVGFVINVLILAWVSRRLLGVPVGWIRLAIISAMIIPLTSYAMDELIYLIDPNIDSSLPGVLLLIVVLMGSIVAVELIILTVLEALVPTRSMPSPLSVIRGIPAAWRRTRRYAAIWWILLKRGLTMYLSPAPPSDRETTRVARSLRYALSDAGVTFVKFGQMLATRADLLPAPFIRELSMLHSSVDPEPWSAVGSVVEDAFDAPVREVFAELSEQPMAAASVAQIHAARLADGREVVVKVQRPKARAQVTADLDILRRLAERLETRTSWGKDLGAAALAEGFAASLHEELDYTVEMRNMLAVAESGPVKSHPLSDDSTWAQSLRPERSTDDPAQDSPSSPSGASRYGDLPPGQATSSDLVVPTPIQELCSERVLVMTRIQGKPLSSASDELATLTAEQRAGLASCLANGVMRQIFVTGIFHADLHPGNVIYTTDGDLALLDFGSVGRLDRSTRTSLILLLYAVDRQDAIAATDALLNVMDRPAELDDRALEREIGGLLLQYGGGLPSGGAASMFAEMVELIVGHGFRVPPQLAAVFRTLATLDGTLRLLDPNVDMVALARAQGSELAQHMFGRDAVKTQIEHQLVTVLPLLSRLPRRLARITEQLEEGSFSMNVSPLRQPADRRYVSGVGDQFTLAVLGCALGFGGLFLLTREGSPQFMTNVPLWPFIGVTLLFLAFTLGARVLANIFFRHE